MTDDKAARIKMLRETKGISLQEARLIVEREDLHNEIDRANSLDEIKAILHHLAERIV
ncbi:hypothetical protein [Mesorhizobium sp. M1A.F.Ca.ET.072.01.1.1]|uniref:hypothetical protein n=1 Tax=Mesorhizobium sp. M1A.F.Ca.ET.072.01.1.1 TaxID=2496753 RepID=UPI001676415B|nr:hypothetical protein [Mesorhizobium sp. M1A.F.Ca.ET.072.01.1.1]